MKLLRCQRSTRKYAHLKRNTQLLCCVAASGCALGECIERDVLQTRSDLCWLSDADCAHSSSNQTLRKVVRSRIGPGAGKDG